jgi:hypothetical protein
MTTYNTGNPVGSVSVKDLYDNAENLDQAVNTPETTWVDRLGHERLSLAGMASAAGDATIAIQAAQSALDSKNSASASAGAAAASADRASAAADLTQASSATVWRSTLAALTAAMAGKPTGTPGVVTNDPDAANNGYWLWNGSSLTRTILQPADMRSALPYNGIVINGSSLNVVLTQGVHRGNANGGYVDLPPDFPAASAFSLVNLNLSTVGDSSRFVTQSLRQFTTPWNSWSRLVDRNNLGLYQWERDATATYRGSVSVDLNTLTQPGQWIYTGSPANRPVGAAASGMVENTAYGSYYVQTVRDLNSPLLVWERINRTSPVSHGLWSRVYSSAVLEGTTAFFGDSMTQSSDYPSWIAQRTGLTALKFGFGGCNLARHNRSAESSPYYDKLCMYNLARYIATGDYSEAVAAADWLAANTSSDFRPTVALMQATNWANVKRLTMMFGTNDWDSGVALGADADVTADGSTFKGAFNYIVQTLLAAYPHLDLIFISSPWRWRVSTTRFDSDLEPQAVTGLYLYEYVDAMLTLGPLNKVPVLDMYRTSGINKFNHEFTIPDGLHPGDGEFGGKRRVSDRIGGFLIGRA